MADLKRPSDREELSLNPITKKLDLVRQFNPDRIITHERNVAGTLLSTYDYASDSHIIAGPDVVVDQYGNVVTVG